MRGLFEASLLLPALVASLVLPDVDIEDFEDDRVISDRSSAVIGVELSQASSDEPAIHSFRLDVFPSEEPCGLGNVTVDGQVLPQTLEGDVATGKGYITTDRKSLVGASWWFHCVKVNGVPDSQFMKFVIDIIDGEAVEDTGFSALFRQTGSPEILNLETDLSLPDEVVANPNPDGLRPVGQDDQKFRHFDIEQEVDELHWMRAQLKELEYLIFAKEQAINAHAHAHFEDEIKDCDSLKCLAKAIVDKAHRAASRVLDNFHGHHGDQHQHNSESEFAHSKDFHRWSGSSKKHSNQTCGPHKHGNHTHGNHTHSPPPWRKHHHRPLPICRYPPPPKMGGPPHDFPPPPHFHHDGPHHGNFDRPENDRPHREERPDHDGPPHVNFNGPEHDGEPAREGHHGPPGDHGPHEHHDHQHSGPEHEMEPPREGHHGPPGHESPNDHPYGRPDHGPDFDHPPRFNDEAPFMLSDSKHDQPGPHPFDGPPGHGPRPHHGLHPAFHIIKFVVIGVLMSLLFIALHRRHCNAHGRASRTTRSEERCRRRAHRCAAHQIATGRFFASHFGPDVETVDYEEKRQVILAGDAEDGMSTTMSEEISQLRNAADVVDEMVAARHFQPSPVLASALVPERRDFDLGSQGGDGDDLPAYEDNDGSEMSSMVADGFRYTPGSTEYSPANSPAGSVSDILGPDTKQ